MADITGLRRENFLADLGKQLKYYSFGMFKGEKHPFPVTEQEIQSATEIDLCSCNVCCISSADYFRSWIAFP